MIRNAETNGKLSEDRAVPALTRTQNKQHSEEMITPFHSVAICTGTRYHYSVLFLSQRLTCSAQFKMWVSGTRKQRRQVNEADELELEMMRDGGLSLIHI